MKVLQVSFTYPEGSNARILQQIHERLTEYGHSSYISYGRGKTCESQNVYKCANELECVLHSIQSLLFGVDFGYSYFSTLKLLTYIKVNKFDLVHLHGLNGHFVNAYKLLDFLKKNNIPVVITMHSENLYTAGCEHAFDCVKWEKECKDCSRIKGLVSQCFRDDAFYCFSRIKNCYSDSGFAMVGVSEWLTSRAKKSAVFSESQASFYTINNGVDTSVFRHLPNIDRKITKGTDYKYTLLHVTPNFSNKNKGGGYILELANRMKDSLFIIVGNGIPAHLPENVMGYGPVTDSNQLASIYNSADVTILTSKRETFSLVCAESLCCGTPVAGFKSGGPESIAIKEYTEFVEYGNIDELHNVIKGMLKSAFDRRELSKLAAERYSSRRMADEYIKLYQKMIGI